MSMPGQSPETNAQPPLEFKASFSLLDKDGRETEGGDARLSLDDTNLGLKKTGKTARLIPLRDIYEMDAADYAVTLKLATLETLTLKYLGHDYDNFRREVALRRRDLALSDLLMEEPLKMGNLHAVYHWLDASGAEKQQGRCELRLYQTALIMVPELFMPARLRYTDINTTEKKDYHLIVRTEDGQSIVFEQMGRNLDPLANALEEQRNSLELAVQALVKRLMPSADMPAIQKLSTLMREGRAARRADIEAVGQNLWNELEAHLTGSEAGDEYNFLKSLGKEQDICIGVKRGLKEGESDYLWFMVPVYDADPAKAGNAVIMEALSAEDESRATYAFRMTSRKEYPKLKTYPVLRAHMKLFLETVNRALIAINFRREPIYLADDALARPQYEKYSYSIARIPELQTLRQLYIGRVIHSSPEQWQADIKDLLTFNTGTTDDGKKWNRKTIDQDTEEPAGGTG